MLTLLAYRMQNVTVNGEENKVFLNSVREYIAKNIFLENFDDVDWHLTSDYSKFWRQKLETWIKTRLEEEAIGFKSSNI